MCANVVILRRNDFELSDWTTVDTHVPLAELSAREVCRITADPEQFSGGGAVAALSAGYAAAITLLVARLSERRRRKRAGATEAYSVEQQLLDLQSRFLTAADRDLSALDALLQAQRNVRDGGSREPYIAALEAAAREPVALADDIALLLEVVQNEVTTASRFTVSDLGAAAAIGRGAAQAALLTATVNVALLRAEHINQADVDDLAARIATVAAQIDASAQEIINVTNQRIGETNATRASNGM